ncbi:hypothetical protein [Amycolatopsis sp. BJA-103]|uniref:hypothetical protein n=1 Tax=Amycolatopsis sp. BJA-103 TaxID=1911175 RepID=UPI000C75A340|nr:hypothetical protein [Amycolatopsis sp. BJA-103]AUI56807.1 hypothetical protein BKN51_00320 [Amycolatopsis sp. BJA-103]PNE13450.1 hypothetical protein B1H26_40190 [Amycolatopsis sp. BJA-103]
MTDIAAAARIGAYIAERNRHMHSQGDVIHGFGLGEDAKVLRASDVRAVLADLSGITRPERCQDCATDPAGPCPMCALAIYGDVDGLAYLDTRDEVARLVAIIAETRLGLESRAEEDVLDEAERRHPARGTGEADRG